MSTLLIVPQVVTLPNGLRIGKYPVTNAEYYSVMHGPEITHADRMLPVTQVSWYDAQNYCTMLGLLSNQTIRLPTEAEWEYACRAGSTSAYHFGDDPKDLHKYAWFSNNSQGHVHPVGQKLPNTWGLYDMHGNVWEWCQDRVYSGRAVRGGCWVNGGWIARSAFRFGIVPDSRFDGFGFRIVIST